MGEIVKDTCYMEMTNGRQLSAKAEPGKSAPSVSVRRPLCAGFPMAASMAMRQYFFSTVFNNGMLWGNVRAFSGHSIVP